MGVIVVFNLLIFNYKDTKKQFTPKTFKWFSYIELTLKYGDVVEIKKDGDVRLVLSCTVKRAKQDAHNRQRGLARLQKRMAGGRLTKQNKNNRATTNISRWRAR